MRSSELKTAEDYCPGALNYLRDGVPYDRDVFHVGTAAHAMMEMAIKERDRPIYEQAERVMKALVQQGRTFDGRPEPPMPMKQAIDGVNLAVAYIENHGLPPEGAWAERLLAINRDGSKAKPGRDSWWRAAIDAMWTEVDYDQPEPAPGVVVRDWKSAWVAAEADCDSTQSRGQALCALAAHPDAEWVRIEVTLLRTGRTYAVTHWVNQSQLLFKDWLDDIDRRIRLIGDGKDGYNYAPGANCLGCPWSYGCKASTAKGDDVLVLSEELARLENRQNEATKKLKGLLKESRLIDLGKMSVGYLAVPERSVRGDAAKVLCDEWGIAESDDRARGLVGHLITVSGVSKVAAHLKRPELESVLLMSETKPKFGLHRKKTGG